MSELIRNQNEAYESLILCLVYEVEMYQELSRLLKEKQSCIISGDIESLENIVHEEQRLIPKVRTATQAREVRAATIGAVSKLTKKTPTLKELIDLSPSHISKQLIEFREHLITSLDQIAHANRENEFLLNSSVELVRGLVQVLLGKEDNKNTYYGGQGMIANDHTPKANVDFQV